MTLPSGFTSWLNKKLPEAQFIDDDDVMSFFDGEDDGEDLLQYYLESFEDRAHDDQLESDRVEVDDGDFDDDDDDDDWMYEDVTLDSEDDDIATDGDNNGTHYTEEVDVNGDGDTDIVETCTDGDGDAEVVVTSADSDDEQKKVDEHLALDEHRDTMKNILSTLSEHRY